MNKRKVGADKERIAAGYLENLGYEIVETNFYSRAGELDLILRDGAYLVFAEVKYRADARSGHPLEAVTKAKQKNIIRTARYYLYRNGYPEDMPCRFDVIAILGEEITHLKGAFEAW